MKIVGGIRGEKARNCGPECAQLCTALLIYERECTQPTYFQRELWYIVAMTATRRSAIAPKNYEVSTTHGVVDYQTGEVTPITHVKEKRATRYGFVGGYCLMGLLNITKLRKIKMSGTGKDLALLIVEEASYSGVCDKTYSQLADELGVHRSQVTRLVAILEQHGIVYRLGGRKSTALLVNPSFAFRGNPTEHQTAMKRWAEYHPLFAVTPSRQALAS